MKGVLQSQFGNTALPPVCFPTPQRFDADTLPPPFVFSFYAILGDFASSFGQGYCDWANAKGAREDFRPVADCQPENGGIGNETAAN